MTLGAAAACGVRLIVWCKACRHQVEPDPAEMDQQYGGETTVLDWRERLVCSRRKSRDDNMVVTGSRLPSVPVQATAAPQRFSAPVREVFCSRAARLHR